MHQQTFFRCAMKLGLHNRPRLSWIRLNWNSSWVQFRQLANKSGNMPTAESPQGAGGDLQPKEEQKSTGRKIVDRVSVIPHPVSKLRLFSYAIYPDETDYERRLRERRIRIQEMNHDYWSQINIEFNQKKKEYIEKELKNRTTGDVDFTSSQTHEELAQFYKKFLDENHRKYIAYNFQWYRNNLELLWPSMVVAVIRFKRGLVKRFQR